MTDRETASYPANRQVTQHSPDSVSRTETGGTRVTPTVPVTDGETVPMAANRNAAETTNPDRHGR
jgi:hypothetical protein